MRNGADGDKNDLEERDSLIERLSRSEERYHALFKYYPIGTVVVDQEGRITEYNLARERAGTRPPRIGEVMYREYAGRHRIDMYEELMGVIRSGVAKEFSDLAYGDRVLQVQISPFPGGAIIISMDITEARRDQAEKKKLEAQLQQARKMEAIANLAGGIAHLFNNALAVLAAHADLMKMKLLDHPAVSGHIEPMDDTIHKMAQLTGQLLAYARGGKYQPKTMSLSGFVQETLPLVKHAVRPDIRIDSELPEETWPVHADFTQMQMVLTAVLANASDAIEGEGVIRVSAGNREMEEADLHDYPGLKPGPHAFLTVQDNGKGMDEETRRHIFEPFFTTKSHGRGLGMAAVYGVVKNHDGWIQVESEPGRGTSVQILLPARIEGPREAKGQLTLFDDGTGTILLVEDEEMVMEATRQMLEVLGNRVIEAGSGARAIEVARDRKEDIDLVILDIQLPDMHGRDIYPRLMEIRPGLKVVVCSGYSIDGPAQEILKAGADGFLQKPFTMASLSEILGQVLGVKRRSE
jgi:signal transduction histidine kinase/CheY-like chemotaxis protein